MQLSNQDVYTLIQVKHDIQRSVYLPISVKDILRGTDLSETRLTQGFKFLYQHTVSRYHLVVSMEYAHTLLTDGLPVKEVAIKLGYRSQSHFNRSFRQVFSIPPSFIHRNIHSVN